MPRFINARYVKDKDLVRVIDCVQFGSWGPARDPTKSPPFVSAETAYEMLYGLPSGDYVLVWVELGCPDQVLFDLPDEREAAAWCVRQGIDPPDDLVPHLDLLGWKDDTAPAKPRRNLITVYRDGKQYQLDTEAGPKWIGKGYGTDYDGFEGWLWWTDETLYRRKRWLLISESRHREAPELPCDSSLEWLTDEQAADWFTRNGFDPPADVAHLATIRAADDVTDEEIEAGRQREAAYAQLSPDEELELMFPTEKPATDHGEPPAQPTASQSGEAAIGVGVVSPAIVQSFSRIERRIEPDGTISATPQAWQAFNALDDAAARNAAMPPDEREKLDGLFGAALTRNAPRDNNALAIEFLSRHQEQLRENPWWYTDRKAADEIGCSPSTASTLPALKAFKKRRGPKPKQGPGKVPRVVSFTEKLGATIGKPDDELERLISEGKYEPSPLDEDPPGAPLRVKIGRRAP